MAETDVFFFRPLRNYKSKVVFELSYTQNDYLAIKIQKGLTFQQLRQNYKWLNARNEVTKQIGLVAVDAIEPIETNLIPNLPTIPVPNTGGTSNAKGLAAFQQQTLRKISLSQKNLEQVSGDTYVPFFGCDIVDVKGTNAAFNGHNLNNVFFITPVLCIHCKDFIWGRGRQGVSCSVKLVYAGFKVRVGYDAFLKFLLLIFYWSLYII